MRRHQMAGKNVSLKKKLGFKFHVHRTGIRSSGVLGVGLSSDRESMVDRRHSYGVFLWFGVS